MGKPTTQLPPRKKSPGRAEQNKTTRKLPILITKLQKKRIAEIQHNIVAWSEPRCWLARKKNGNSKIKREKKNFDCQERNVLTKKTKKKPKQYPLIFSLSALSSSAVYEHDLSRPSSHLPPARTWGTAISGVLPSP